VQSISASLNKDEVKYASRTLEGSDDPQVIKMITQMKKLLKIAGYIEEFRLAGGEVPPQSSSQLG